MRRKSTKEAPVTVHAGTGITVPVPPFRNPELVRTLSHPDMAPEAWAAYKLGYEPQAMSVCLSLHQPYYLARGHDTQDSIPIFAFELTSALDVLARTVPVPVRYELTQSLAKLNEFNSDATAMMLYDAYDVSTLERMLDQGRELLDSLQIQISNSIPPESPLRPWYIIGWNLGDWWARNFDSDTPPSIAPILNSFTRLSEAERTTAASFMTIAEMIRISAGKESRQLRRVLRLLGLIRVKTRGQRAALLSPDMHGAFRILHNRIESELLERQRHFGWPQASRPVWDKSNRELRFDEKVCKRIKSPRALHAIRVLDEFQKHNWPRRLIDPELARRLDVASRVNPSLGSSSKVKALIEKDPIRRLKRETIRSLNDDLEVLKFSGAGNATEIEWKFAHSSGSTRSPG